MTKKVSNKSTKKTVVKRNNSSKKTPAKNNNLSENRFLFRKINPKIAIFVIFLCAVLLIFATYAWFSTNLNIKINTFNLVVSKNSDLAISFDGINFSRTIEINKDNVFNNLGDLYPNYLTQWPSNGLIPVSSPGLIDSNSPRFEFFETKGVLYHVKAKDRGFVRTTVSKQDQPREYNSYLAFDIFIKNDTDSPIADNLFLDESIYINASGEVDEETLGLVNSFRVGVIRIGTVSLDASVNEIQNISCNNNCSSIIYEPNNKAHTKLSIERAKKYNVDLVDGHRFPTYAYIKAGGPLYVDESISGSSKINREYFTVQETIVDENLNSPIFELPNGISKYRIYVWIEGQDIDSLETNSKGTDVDISISFNKDTAGWDHFNE